MWGFKSPLAHEWKMAPDLGFSSSGWGSFSRHVLSYVLSVPEMRREAGRCGLLHRRGDVTVDVHRRGDGGVPEALLHHLRMLAQLQQERGVRVPESFDRDSCHRAVDCGDLFEAAIPAAGHRVGRAQLPVIVSEHVGVGLAQFEREFRPGDLVRGQHFEGFGVDVDDAGVAGLCALRLSPVVGVDRAADADSAGLLVDVRPLQSECFRAAYPGLGDKPPQREQFVVQLVAIPGEKPGELVDAPGRDLGFLRPHLAGLGRVHRALLFRRVHDDQPVIDRGVEDRAKHDMHFVDRVRRQPLPFAILVLAARLFQFPVVGADAGRGELVEPDPAEVGGDVVADDLPIPLDRRVREAER